MENIFSSFLAQTPKTKKFAIAQEEVRRYLCEVADSIAEENGSCCDPDAVAARIRSILLPEDYQQEVFGIVGFSVRQKVTVCKIIHRGNVESVAVDLKVLLRALLTSETPTTTTIICSTAERHRKRMHHEHVFAEISGYRWKNRGRGTSHADQLHGMRGLPGLRQLCELRQLL